jgi:Uma2 family endonuclease
MNQPIEDYNDNLFKQEMIDGKIYLMAPPRREHREVQFNLAFIFNDYFKRKKKRCRAIFEDRLNVNERNYFEPDLKILCRENGKTDDIPVIVIEILSKSTHKRDLGVKMKKYAEIGIKEYWIVAWELSLITVYLLNDEQKYEFYDSYAFFLPKDILKEHLNEEEIKAIVKEFSTVTFPDLTVQLADVFDIFE